MVLQASRAIGILLWTLFPSVAIWVGLYQLQSAVWAFALYHGLCLLPAIVVFRKLWLPTFARPVVRDVLILIGAAVLFSLGAVLGYEILGTKLLSNDDVVALLNRVGWRREMFWPISVYAVVVNPLVEELFWRGIVFNELERWKKVPFKHFALVWSSVAYALFHYLIFRLVLFPVYAEIGIVLLAIYGAMLALIYRKTNSILTTAVAHGLLTDTAAIALMLDLARRYPNMF